VYVLYFFGSFPGGTLITMLLLFARVFRSGATLSAAWNYGAVERAFRDAAGKGGGRIFEPDVGKKFESIQEAFEFYNLYSWEIGFGIRLGRSRENKSGRRAMQDIVCACEVNM
jgi:hypothetical protein